MIEHNNRKHLAGYHPAASFYREDMAENMMWPSIRVSSSISFPMRVRPYIADTGAPEAEPLLGVVLGLSRASAQLAVYLEPREHGVASSISHICEAIADLHACAEALAAIFAVDLACAHRTRLEA